MIKKVYKYLLKHKLIVLLIIVSIIRFILSYKLPIFCVYNLGYDDGLMFKMTQSLLSGNYLGVYNNLIMAKGLVFPCFLAFIRVININYGFIYTFLYIIGCASVTLALKKNIPNKKYLAIIYAVLLFNPISYSSELFQRLYRNSLSVILFLFFISFIIRIINDEDNKVINYICLGLFTSLLYLTREDSIWTIVVLLLLIIYKMFVNKKIKMLLVNLIPFTILLIMLNIVSLINYNHYGIYTYNEINNTAFKDFYINLKSIKSNTKMNRVSITKEKLYKLSEVSKEFGFSKEDIDLFYDNYTNDEEIENNNIVWYLRNYIYIKFQFLEATKANDYFKKVSDEMNQLFKEKKLEREFTIKSVNIATPSINDLLILPKNILKTIIYTTCYDDVKTFTKLDELENIKYDNNMGVYKITNIKRYETENILSHNGLLYEIMRIIYKYLTLVLSIYSIYLCVRNIKKKNKINVILGLLTIIYLCVICGIAYNHTTAFQSIRYLYLGYIYIIQSLFILLSIFLDKKIRKNNTCR